MKKNEKKNCVLRFYILLNCVLRFFILLKFKGKKTKKKPWKNPGHNFFLITSYYLSRIFKSQCAEMT